MPWHSPLLAQACANIQCPSGAQCACINCAACNSGNFSAQCVCYPIAGKITCATQSGDCALSICAKCVSESTSQTCTFYAGCNGVNCPSGGCIGVGGGGFRASQAQIIDPQTVPDGANVWKIAYTIRNSSSKNLRTLVTEWTLKSVTGEETRFQRKVDSWKQGRRIAAPFTDGVDDLRIRLTADAGFSITKVEVLYAEYHDGTIEGSAADCVRKKVLADRAETVASIRGLLEQIKGGLGIEEVRKLLNQDPALSYLSLETVGAPSIARVVAAANRIVNQPQ